MGIQFDTKGREIPDPRPLELAPGSIRPESLQSMMQRLIREQLSRHAVEQGEESFEEANDFDIEDEDFDDPLTKYEEMGVEHVNAGESEEGPAISGNASAAESPGLRTGGAGAPGNTRGSEAGNVDSQSGVSADPSLPTQDRKADVGARSGSVAVHGRGVGQGGE